MSILERIMGGLSQYVPRRNEQGNISDFEKRKIDFYDQFQKHQQNGKNFEEIKENIIIDESHLLDENVQAESPRNFSEKVP